MFFAFASPLCRKYLDRTRLSIWAKNWQCVRPNWSASAFFSAACFFYCTKSYPDNSWKFMPVECIRGMKTFDIPQRCSDGNRLKFIRNTIPLGSKEAQRAEKNRKEHSVVISSKESHGLESCHSNFCYSFFQMFIFVGAELFNFLCRISAASKGWGLFNNIQHARPWKKRGRHTSLWKGAVFTFWCGEWVNKRMLVGSWSLNVANIRFFDLESASSCSFHNFVEDSGLEVFTKFYWLGYLLPEKTPCIFQRIEFPFAKNSECLDRKSVV